MKISQLLSGLKSEIRTGWAIEGVNDPESVADHTWGMSLLLLYAFERLEEGERELDRERTLKMAIVHDLQESITGDLVPGRAPKEMTRQEKARLERNAEEQILAAGDMVDLESLWEEYRQGLSPEARLVKDIDRLEMAIQALAYRERGDLPAEAAESFFGSAEIYGTETGREMYRDLVERRRVLPSA